MPVRPRAVPPLLLILLMVSLSSPLPGAESDAPDDKPGPVARMLARRIAWAETTDAWLFASPTAVMVTLQDTRMTPLVYSGPGAGAQLSDVIVNDRWIIPTAVSAHLALPLVPEVLQGTYQNVSMDIESLVMRWLPGVQPRAGDTSDQSRAAALGAGMRAGANIRLYDKLQNNASNTDILVSLNAAAHYEVGFTMFGRPMAYHVRFSGSAFSYVRRTPSYALYGVSHHWLPPWRLPRLRVDTALSWNLKWAPENRARFYYTWDFHGMNDTGGLHVLRVASHTLGVGFGMKRL